MYKNTLSPKVKLVTQILFIFFVSFYFVSKYTGEVQVEYKIKILENENRWQGELFYSSNDAFTNKKRKSIHYKKFKDKYQTIKINLGNTPDITSIRLDPLTNNGILKIQNMIVSYKDQLYTLDFTKITDQHYKHNIKIMEQHSEYMMIQCLGKDPHIVLTNDIHFNAITIKDIIFSLILTFIIYMMSRILFKLPYFEHIILLSPIFIYSWYAILFSSDNMASTLLIFFALLSIGIMLKNNIYNTLPYIKNMGIFLLIYFFMSYLSIYITTEHANIDYLNAKIPYIILAVLIPAGFYKINNFNMHFFKIMLTILLISMATFILLLNYNIISINNIQMLEYTMKRTPWTQKNYMFWYVLLMFATLSFYDTKNKYNLLIIFSIIVLSYFTIFGGYSNSAKLSFGVGILTFFILSIFKIKKNYLLIFIWVFTLYIIFSPLLLSFIELISDIPRLGSRAKFYNTSLAFIKENWLFGYGYGSTLTIALNDFVSTINLPKQYVNTYNGGHPHNLALLFWLEFGIFGALFLTYFIHKLLKSFIEKTYVNINHAALFGMIVAFDIITSFSWSIWYPQVLLTFAFFGVMITLSMNIQSKQR